jgi:hypothetical protein
MGSDGSGFPAEVRAAYVEALSDPAALHAICEEYRAAATIDVARDEDDLRAGRRIACRTLALWGAYGGSEPFYFQAPRRRARRSTRTAGRAVAPCPAAAFGQTHCSKCRTIRSGMKRVRGA